jgi:hypothetical protein
LANLKTKKNKSVTEIDSLSSSTTSISELEDRPLDEVLKNKKIKFVDFGRMIEILKNINQTRKSFYINNMLNGNTFQTDICNFNDLDKYFDNQELKTSQIFISMNENIHLKLENKDFKKNIHFDLYRLKLNFVFYIEKWNQIFI